MVSYRWSIIAINNVFTPTVEITSHNESHTQCYSIKSKDIKNKSITQTLTAPTIFFSFSYSFFFDKMTKIFSASVQYFAS